MDVLDIKKALNEFHRVLSQNGKLALSITHPAFFSAPTHGWHAIPKDSNRTEDKKFWKIDRYFDHTVGTHIDGIGLTFHRPLSDYIQAIIEAGFVITDFLEPSPSKELLESNERWNTHSRVALILIIGAKKI
jgi:hypothetical protein